MNVGDTIKIHYSFKEKDKKKNQIFEGILMKIRGHGENKSFPVRKVTRSNIGVERIFPVISPFIEKIEVEKKGKSKRAKIYFIRGKSQKEIKDNLYAS